MRVKFPAYGKSMTLEVAMKYFMYLEKLTAPMRFISWGDLDLHEKKCVMEYYGITKEHVNKHGSFERALDNNSTFSNPKLVYRTDRGYSVIMTCGKIIFERNDGVVLFLRIGPLTEKGYPEEFQCQK